MANATQDGLFAKLPSELREMIWLRLMPYNRRARLNFDGDRSRYRCRKRRKLLYAPCLSRNIYTELIDLLYRNWNVLFYIDVRAFRTMAVLEHSRVGYYRIQDLRLDRLTRSSCLLNMPFWRFNGIVVDLATGYNLCGSSYAYQAPLCYAYKAIRFIVRCLKPSAMKEDVAFPTITIRALYEAHQWVYYHFKEDIPVFHFDELHKYAAALGNTFKQTAERTYSGGFNDLYLLLWAFGPLKKTIELQTTDLVFEQCFTLKFKESYDETENHRLNPEQSRARLALQRKRNECGWNIRRASVNKAYKTTIEGPFTYSTGPSRYFDINIGDNEIHHRLISTFIENDSKLRKAERMFPHMPTFTDAILEENLAGFRNIFSFL